MYQFGCVKSRQYLDRAQTILLLEKYARLLKKLVVKIKTYWVHNFFINKFKKYKKIKKHAGLFF